MDILKHKAELVVKALNESGLIDNETFANAIIRANTEAVVLEVLRNGGDCSLHQLDNSHLVCKSIIRDAEGRVIGMQG